MPSRRSLLVAFACAATLSSLAPAARAADLLVSAAASLTNAFQEIGKSFEATHPGAAVRFNFAASGQLLQQLAQGAPVDVFASADEETMDQAEQQHLLKPGSRVDFASNALVVIVPADQPAPSALAQLTTPPYRQIAIGVPASVPVGRYTQTVLERAGLWRQIAAKTVGAQSVRQALDYVARGEVDAGFVYATDAALMKDKVKVAFVVPTPVPVRYPIATIATAPNGAAADRFVTYVASPAAQAVLARHGFAKP
jgi:molybdate transport system substrate-binding protein